MKFTYQIREDLDAEIFTNLPDAGNSCAGQQLRQAKHRL
jgi:hypothetical protein